MLNLLCFYFQMASLASALGRGANYSVPIRCKIIAVSANLTFQSNGQTVTYRTVGLAQGPTAMKATIYNTHFNVFTAGHCVAITYYAMSNGNMTIRSTARVHLTGNTVQVDADTAVKAQHIVTPPSSNTSISALATATPGALYTITGTVQNVSIHLSIVHTRYLQGHQQSKMLLISFTTDILYCKSYIK